MNELEAKERENTEVRERKSKGRERREVRVSTAHLSRVCRFDGNLTFACFRHV
jgi:hypothetical protein